MGVACDSILSARIVLHDGRLVHTDSEHEPDLFWAIKGAGYYFGAVTEITLKTYHLSSFGTPSGRHWIGTFMYPLDRANEVVQAVQSIITTSQPRTAGLVMIAAPSPHFKPMIAVVPHYFGDLKEGPKQFQSLNDLGPVFSNESTPLVPNLSDHLDFACGKGGCRRFTVAGLREFKSENCLKLTDLLRELLNSCPDAAASGYFIEWHGLPPTDSLANSAFGHRDIRIWM